MNHDLKEYAENLKKKLFEDEAKLRRANKIKEDYEMASIKANSDALFDALVESIPDGLMLKGDYGRPVKVADREAHQNHKKDTKSRPVLRRPRASRR